MLLPLLLPRLRCPRALRLLLHLRLLRLLPALRRAAAARAAAEAAAEAPLQAVDGGCQARRWSAAMLGARTAAEGCAGAPGAARGREGPAPAPARRQAGVLARGGGGGGGEAPRLRAAARRRMTATPAAPPLAPPQQLLLQQQQDERRAKAGADYSSGPQPALGAAVAVSGIVATPQGLAESVAAAPQGVVAAPQEHALHRIAARRDAALLARAARERSAAQRRMTATPAAAGAVMNVPAAAPETVLPRAFASPERSPAHSAASSREAASASEPTRSLTRSPTRSLTRSPTRSPGSAQGGASPLLSETPDKNGGYLVNDAELVGLLDAYRTAMEALLDAEAGELGGANLEDQENRSGNAPRSGEEQGCFLERARAWEQSNASSASRFSLARFNELMRGVELERIALAQDQVQAQAQAGDAEGPSWLRALARSVALQEHELAAKRGRLRHLEAALAARVDGSVGAGSEEKAALRRSLALLNKHVAQRRATISEEQEDIVVGLLEPLSAVAL